MQVEPDDERLSHLERYLRQRASAEKGPYYFKSKYIADDLDMTSHEIGVLVSTLRKADTSLTIEKWSYTNATTWRVIPSDQDS